jgi:hypothetical protein
MGVCGHLHVLAALPLGTGAEYHTPTQPIANCCFAGITASKLLHSFTGNMIEELFFNFDFQE